MRHCSKPGCNRSSVATLTYDYKNSTAVLGPLATVAEPHTYDLCENHASHLTVPKGWEVVRLKINYDPLPPSDDDLMALVEAVREAANPQQTPLASSRDIGGDFSAFGATEEPPSRNRLTVISGDSDEKTPSPSRQQPEEGPF